jgi:hypothetical protein
MVRRQRGDVIFIGSDVALRQRPHMGAYGAGKAPASAHRSCIPGLPRPRWAGPCPPKRSRRR